MQTTRTWAAAAILIATAMALSVLVTAPADANTGHHDSPSSGPCPNWSIQDVLDDRDSDWDGDRISNVDEIYVAGGLDPCVYDSSEFCGAQPQYCYEYPSAHHYDPYYGYVDPYYYEYYGYYDPYHYYHPYHTVYYDPYGGYYFVYVPKVFTCSGGYWSWSQVNAHPHGDWDGDGVSNHREAAHGANPCSAPCPNADFVDVLLNPNGDWDHDGRSNHYEFQTGTNPCVAASVFYTHPVPDPTPHAAIATDKDDYNPCPAGYPYYHPENGQCYANPVKPWG